MSEPTKRKTRGVTRHRGIWTARTSYIDPASGKRRELRRNAPNKIEAERVLWEELIPLAKRIEDGETGGKTDRVTFSDLCTYYLEHYAKEPRFRGDVKIAGLRSYKWLRGQVELLRAEFGTKLLTSITYEDIRRFRERRFDQRIVKKYAYTPKGERAAATRENRPARVEIREKTLPAERQRSVANVNRLFTVLRKLLNVAVARQWISRNVFNDGPPLINVKDEGERLPVILSREDETRLLAACSVPHRMHLRALIITALDTGCRAGELKRLTWSDVDFLGRAITIRARNTKTLKGRVAKMTSAIFSELAERFGMLQPQPTDLVFGVRSDFKRSFASACKEASLEGLHFHDLRHNTGTRLAEQGLSVEEIGKQLGHAKLSQVTYRYISLNERMRTKVVNALEAFRDGEASNQGKQEQESPTAVN